MGVLKLHTLKQKLWAIVAASFVARVIMFFALPNIPSSLAPDEGTYARVAIATFDNTLQFESEFYNNVYQISQSLITPAQFFILIGVDAISAVRLVSSIYGFLTLFAVAYLSSKLLQSDKLGVKGNKKVERLAVTLLMVYAFIPSHFVWSNLGLRESPNEFWLIMAFFGVFFLYKEGQSKKPLLAVLVTTSILGTFNSRQQVGWALVVTLLIYSMFNLRNKLTYLLITSVLTGLLAGHLTTTSFVFVTSDLYVAKESTPTPTKESTPTPTKESTPTPTKESTPTPTKESTPTPINDGEVNASELCDGARSKVEYEGRDYNCVKSGTVTKRERSSNLAEVAIDQVEVIPGKQIVNQVGAASMIKRLACPWAETSEIGKYGCLAFRAPYMTLTFLFRPLPFIDTTSLSSVFAATENLLWIFMFALIVYRVSRVKEIPFLAELAPALIFFSLYVVGAGSYEGNMGTAFRHKSLILWVPLLLIFALFWQKDSQSSKPQGNNSQESAV
jgi:hypothetical protein